jgi:multiple sugar transport system ATP-binding protein
LQRNGKADGVFAGQPLAVQGASALKSAGVPAQVIIAELMGADLLVFTQVGGQRVVVRADPGLKVSAGETVHLTFNENCLHVFSKTTQENLSI